jgi:CheY-like chemotaxis protein
MVNSTIAVTSKIALQEQNARKTKPVILAIEDNEDNNLTIKALLEDEYMITTVFDGILGIESAKLHKPDLILLDINLPEMDGFEVFRKLRVITEVPIIALTANAMKGDKDKFMKFGFNDYIPKPIDAVQMAEVIKKWLNM